MTASKFTASALIALASVAAAGAAFAYDEDYPQLNTVTRRVHSGATPAPVAVVPSAAIAQGNNVGKTRAEVRAEVLQARKNGTLFRAGDDAFPVMADAPGGKTRAEVHAEMLKSPQETRTN